MAVEAICPLDLGDLKKGIIVPVEIFEQHLEAHDWTWQQVARGDFPPAYAAQGKDRHERLQLFQLAIICADPLLWCQAFLREPTDPDHADPYQFFDYQIDSLRCKTSVVHQDGAEVGKTREIVALAMYHFCLARGGSGLIAAPQQTHLDEIIEGMDEQFAHNPALTPLRGHSRIKNGIKRQPHTAFYGVNGFKLDFRPAGFDGEAFRGIHATTFGFFDEAAKAKNPKQWTEFWRGLKPSAFARVYSVPDGDRESDYYKLTLRAAGKANDSDEVGGNYDWRLFRWGKDLMPPPFWTPERRRYFIELYGGEDSPGYRHNVRGEHGDPESTVFPWGVLRHCVREIPDYRALKVIVDTSNRQVLVSGYRCGYELGPDGPLPQQTILIDEAHDQDRFFSLDESGDNEFRRLIRSFFIGVSGLLRGGGDFGFNPDPTELTMWSVYGNRERLVARLQLKSVTYDQQCQGLDALDDVYHPKMWGTDYGNAGSAVAHDLQGLPQYAHKGYDDRLKGFMFQSKSDNIDENGDAILEAKSGKPSKITLKELSTDLIVKRVQRQQIEYPPDPDLISAYTNHTCRQGTQQRIYGKQNDHLIDSQRVATLAGVLGCEAEDIFA